MLPAAEGVLVICLVKSDAESGRSDAGSRLLGKGLAVVDGDRPLELGGRNQRAVLAALVLDAGRAVSVDRLIDAVWGDVAAARLSPQLSPFADLVVMSGSVPSFGGVVPLALACCAESLARLGSSLPAAA